MPLFKYEMKKMFFYHKGLLFIVLYFVLSIMSISYFDIPANTAIEEDLQQYTFYLNQVKGQLSDETERFLTEESIRITEAEIALQNTYDNYYDGIISQSEFTAEAAVWDSVLQNKAGFDRIYEQYTYIRQNTNNRYFLYTNGWDGLLANENIDIIFILLLLLLVAPIFCFESESEMDAFVLTAKNGTKHCALCKIGLAFITVAVLSLLISALQYSFFYLKYGLENGNYPLQSLSYFGTSSKNISLLQTFLLMSACRLFGYLSFAMIIMYVSVCVKKYALTLFSCTAVLLLPNFTFSLSSTKYFLPLPLGFIISTGFFRGNEYERNIYTDEITVVFREISWLAWGLIFLISLCIIIYMFIVIRVRNTNTWSLYKRSCRPKPIIFLLTFCIVVSTLFGCDLQKKTQNNSIYNFSSRQSYENDDYLFYIEDTDGGSIQIVFQNKETGATGNLVTNPMQSLMKIGDSIYGNREYVYYMVYSFDKSKRVEAYDTFSVIEVNTKTFDEKIIYEKNINSEKNTILGIGRVNEAEAHYFSSVHSFFLDENSIYFESDSKEIRRVNRTTGKMEIIIKSPSALTSIAFDGQNIYYSNMGYTIIKYNIRTGNKTEIPDIATMFFVLSDTTMFFINRKDNKTIYSMNMDDFTIKKITDKSVRWVSCDKQYIYFQDYDDMREYRMDFDGGNLIMVDKSDFP